MSFEFFTALSVPTANNINITSDKLVGRELMVDVERKNTNMIYDKVLGFRAIAAQCNTTPRDDDPSHSLPDKTSEPQAYPLTG